MGVSPQPVETMLRTQIKPRRLAFFIHSLEMGGAERVLSLLAMELSKENFVRVYLFDSRKNNFDVGNLAVDLQLPAVQGSLSKVFLLLRRVWAIGGVVKENNYDQVITFMEGSSLPAAIAAFLGGWGKKLTVSVRQNPYAYNFFVRLLMKLFYRPIIKVNTNSLGSKNALEQLLGRPVLLVHNPVHVPRALSGPATSSPFNRYFLFLGRLDPVKRVTDIVTGFGLATKKIPDDVGLCIVGGGPDYENISKKVAELNLGHRVRMFGPLMQPDQLLSNSEAVILASQTEGWPNVLLEAIQAHRKIIASDCNFGPREILEGVGTPENLFPVGDTSVLAEKMIHVLSHKDENYSKRCEEFFRRFEVSEIARQWVNNER